MRTVIKNAPLITEPYAHFCAENVFSDELYQDILHAFPKLELMTPFSAAYAQRYWFRFSEENITKLPFQLQIFWTKLHLDLSGLQDVLFDKFKETIAERFGNVFQGLKIVPRLELYHDKTHYSIGPHTDHPIKVVNLLFYLPSDDNQSHLGTSIYVPKESTFKCEGFSHYDFAGFNEVKTIDYKPNSLFCFCKTDDSFHGVKPITQHNVDRRIMNLCFEWSY